MVELSLWNEPKRFAFIALCAGLVITQILFFSELFLALKANSWSTTGYAMLGVAAATVISALLIPALLWQRFGREVIELDPVRLRIYHDYRLFRRIRLERNYRQFEVQIWTDLVQSGTLPQKQSASGQSRGRLLLILDKERVRTRVSMNRMELEAAANLLERFRQLHRTPGSNLYVVNNN